MRWTSTGFECACSDNLTLLYGQNNVNHNKRGSIGCASGLMGRKRCGGLATPDRRPKGAASQVPALVRLRWEDLGPDGRQRWGSPSQTRSPLKPAVSADV